MIIKADSTNNYTVSLDIDIDWENQTIFLDIRTTDYDTGTEHFTYPASEFSEAIKKFNSLEKVFKCRYKAYKNLTVKDVILLQKREYPPEDIPQIDEAIQKTRYTYIDDDGNEKEIRADQASVILGREDFLSGISRSAFHFTAERPIKGESGSIYFDSSKLFK